MYRLCQPENSHACGVSSTGIKHHQRLIVIIQLHRTRVVALCFIQMIIPPAVSKIPPGAHTQTL